MRVRMKTHITGYRDGQEWPQRGGEIDLPAREADDLVAQGYAEHVAVPPAHTTPAPAPAGGEVPDAAIEVVLAWVDGQPDAARVALAHELGKPKPRTTLVATLEEIAAQGGTDDATTPPDTGGDTDGAAGPDGPPTGTDDAAATGQQDNAGDEAASSRDW